MKSVINWLRSLTLAGKVLVGIGTLIVIGMFGNQNNVSNSPNLPSNQPIQQLNNPAPVITTKFINETRVVPFTSNTINDSTLASGTNKITTVGVNGSETLNYEITYTNGNQTDKKLLSTVVDVQPVNQITSIGTYVAPAVYTPTCSNGSYVNSAGNTVCSPSYSPSGATAKCYDGTYSYSQSRSGTCSHHGGVSQWL